MAKIVNLSGSAVVLPTNHVVPKDGFLDTNDAVLLCPDNAFVLSGQVLSGAMTVSYDGDDPTSDATQAAPSTGPADFSTTMPGYDDAGEQEES